MKMISSSMLRALVLGAGVLLLGSTTAAHADNDIAEKSSNFRIGEARTTSKDECKYSATLDGSMECDTTTSTIAASQITQQVATLAGQTAMGLSAQSNMAEATSTGSQAAMMNAAAATAEAGAVTQFSAGGVNAAMGLIQMGLAAKHKSNAAKIETELDSNQFALKNSRNRIDNGDAEGVFEGAMSQGEFQAAHKGADSMGKLDGGSELGNQMIKNFKIESRSSEMVGVRDCVESASCLREQEVKTRAAQMRSKLSQARDEADHVAYSATSEQEKKSKEALMSGLQQAFVGASQITAGVGAMKSAEEMRKAAAQLQDMQGTPFAMPSIDLGAQDAATASAATQSLSGSGETTTAATEDDDISEDPGALPGPLNLGGPDSTVANAPPPGGFNKGLTSNGPGGGGGGAPGGGGTSASKLDGGATASEVAASRGALSNKDKYLASNGSGGYNAAGGGRGGGGGGGDDMGAFKDMLSQFLPGRKDEAAKDPSMAFGDGRAPAGGQAPTSLLGRNVNIFERISATYQTKEKSGNFSK